jgi:acyl-CoA thioester hydrolase
VTGTGPGPVSRSAITVRYAETDQMAIAYHGNYFAWFEVGRCDWMRAQGRTYREMEAEGIRLPVIEAHCDYRQPSRYDDALEVRTVARLLSPVRVRFEYEIVRFSSGTVAATGFTVHAVADTNGKPKRLPEDLRKLFS